MFQTLAVAALTGPLFSDPAGVGTLSWSYVVHPFDLPWFHVTLGFGVDRRVIFSGHVSDWTDLPTQTQGKDLRLIDVRLVSPSRINGSTDWKMERLVEVWQGDEPASGRPAWVFIVEGGKRYVQAERASPEASLINLVQIYGASGQT